MTTDAQDRCLIAVVGKPNECHETAWKICKENGLDDGCIGVIINVQRECTIIDVRGKDLAGRITTWYLTSRMVNEKTMHMICVKYDDDGTSHVVYSKPLYDHFAICGKKGEEAINTFGNGHEFIGADTYNFVARLFKNE